MRGIIREGWQRLWGTFRRDALDREVREEMAYHLQQATNRNMARGMPPDQARQAALRQFGGTEGHREAARDELRSRPLEAAAYDLRHALRRLRRRPALTAAILLTVSLGLGASTAIFSVVDGVLLRALPFPDADRLGYLQWGFGDGQSIPALARYELEYLRTNATGLEGAATYQSFESPLGEPSEFATVRGLRVSEDFHTVTGLQPTLGRPLSPGEFGPEGADVALVSEELWRTRLGGDPGAIGGTLPLNGRSFTVIGVLPAEFRMPELPEATQVVVPIRSPVDPDDQGRNYTVLARRAATVSAEGLQAELARVSDRYRIEHPERQGPANAQRPPGAVGEPRFSLTSFQQVFVGDLRTLLLVLMGAVALVVTIACVNAANLLLAAGIGREREIALRAALGAGRGRIFRQLMLESLLLAGTAGVIGLWLGVVGLKALLAVLPTSLPRAADIGLDWRVGWFALASALLTGLVFGAAAAAPSLRESLVSGLATGERQGWAGPRRLRQLLVVAEAAIAVILLSGAGLLVTSLQRLRHIDPGFDPVGVVTAQVGRLPAELGADPARWQWERAVLDRLAQLPGVTAAAVVPNFPLERGLNFPMTIEGRPDDWEGAVELRTVSGGYFSAFRIPLLRGRGFEDGRDEPGAPRVAIVNAAFAARYWPEEEPIGKRIELGRFQGQWLGPEFEGALEVVGVAADIREAGLTRPARRTLYVPRSQWTFGSPQFVVRADQPGLTAAAMSEAIRSLDPRVGPATIRDMPAIVSQSIARQRFQTLMLGLFAGSALLLTLIGVYGVMAGTVGQRAREIGIRMALGARGRQVVAEILGQGMRLVLLGSVIGLGLALGLTRFLASMLYGTSPTEPGTLAAGVAVLLVAAGIAAWIPARRAARVAPVEVLRSD